MVPGPGNYKTEMIYNKDGKSVQGNIKSVSGIKFAKETRSGLTLTKDKVNLPGPGSYQLYEEFIPYANK